MGSSVSRVRPAKSAGQMHSDALDSIIVQDQARLKQVRRILVLGTSGSGKSTLMKHMRIHDGTEFKETDVTLYRSIICRNVIEWAHSILLLAKKDALVFEKGYHRELADKVLDFTLGNDDEREIYLPNDIAEAIHQLWNDPMTANSLKEHAKELNLELPTYFFDNIRRIGGPTYRPNRSDILKTPETARKPGLREMKINMGTLTIHLLDPSGQRSERRKWIHYFEFVTSIIFCAPVADYDQARMTESFNLFESVINSRWFLRTSIILLLTKMDEFKQKLPKIPLEKSFPEYTGGADVNKAAKYILWKYMQLNRARLSVYPHIVNVCDTNVSCLVLAAVKETTLQNWLKDSGRL
ncbi:G-protein alpha subunit [Crepidotus variabilis]|uniref:G-protein alpha subunit n=1 Tax=Crepidotus variabilis TaxID=179855 RepID=A0A9P6E7X5_9AGAR|nr:G-protein alpha subunit [Crepidotus variabilis]